MFYLEQEILSQPEILEGLLEGWGTAEAIATAIRRRGPRFAVLAARGSSDNAARYGQYLLGAVNGLAAALATPSLFTVYRRPPRLSDALVMAISQSGRSPDILAVVEEGRRQGAITVAITNDESSPLALAAEHVFPLRAGVERSIAATKTYTASLAALAMLSTALAREEEMAAALRRIPAWVREALQKMEEFRRCGELYRSMEACAVISRGYNYATAYEIALKVKELACVVAEPHSSADFQHGPVALVREGFPVIAVVPEGKVAAETEALLRKLREMGADLVVISARREALALARTPLPIPPGIPEWLSPVVAVVPGQIFALGLALARGLDPDRPRGLQKVTLTE